MRRLRGSDAFLVYSDSPTSPFVTLKAAIYRPTDENDVPDTEEIKGFIKAGVEKHGLMARLRILRVPLDLHHPLWIVDPDFSADEHIFDTELSAPGSKAQLCDFISDLMARPLNPERPLWEVWVVRGLQDGKVAVVSKLHHALADGNTMAAMISDNHSKAGAAHSRDTPIVDIIPSKARMVRDAMIDLAKSYTLDLPEYVHYLKEARAHSRAAGATRHEPPLHGPAPITILNSGGGSGRIYRYETASLPAMKSLAKAHGCTINTMVLAVCSEGLRRYLQDVDTLPDAPLIAAMPVGALGERDFKTLLNSDIHNNTVAIATVPLDISIDDFYDRLADIKRAATAAREYVKHRAGRRLDNFLDYLPGSAIRLLHSVSERRMAKHKNPYANLIISSVKGPEKPLYALDGRLQMLELLSTGNLQDAGSLNITVWSYVDRVCFSCYSRKDALPEPEKINGYLREVLEELNLIHADELEPGRHRPRRNSTAKSPLARTGH